MDSLRLDLHTGDVASRDLKRLADGVIQRRTELSLTQEAFVERAGTDNDTLSLKTLQRIENLQISAPRTKTLSALDRAAGWPPGHARALWEGEQPPGQPSTQSEDPLEPDPADYPDEMEYLSAVYWFLRQSMSHESVMRGFNMAAAIYARKQTEARRGGNPTEYPESHNGLTG